MASSNLPVKLGHASNNPLDSLKSANLVKVQTLSVKESTSVPSVPVARGTIDSRAITGSFTFTLANLKNTLLTLTGTPGAVTATIPSAAVLAGGMQKGASWSCIVYNNLDNTVTFSLGTGVTSGITTLATTVATQLTFIVVENASGSEAVTIVDRA